MGKMGKFYFFLMQIFKHLPPALRLAFPLGGWYNNSNFAR